MTFEFDAMNSFKVLFKRLRSYRKSKWDFEDYPIRTWKNPNAGSKNVAFGAGFINWYMMVAHGESKAQAIEALRNKFNLMQERRADLPRPGTKVPIKYASTEQINKYRDIAQDYFTKVLDQDFNQGFYSDDSALWPFEGPDENRAKEIKNKIIARTLNLYGVDISDVYDEPLFKVLEYIKKNRK